MFRLGGRWREGEKWSDPRHIPEEGGFKNRGEQGPRSADTHLAAETTGGRASSAVWGEWGSRAQPRQLSLRGLGVSKGRFPAGRSGFRKMAPRFKWGYYQLLVGSKC